MTEPGASSPDHLGVLFVCTANVARSPYAERRARVLLRGAEMAFGSAGLPGYPGRAMDDAMAAELRFRGGSPSGHISRSLTSELMSEADIVLTFEYAQRLRILDLWPESSSKVRGLRQFSHALSGMPTLPRVADLLSTSESSSPDSMLWDIEDPYHRGAEAAQRCADEIDEALRRIAAAIGVEPDDYPTRASRHRRRKWPSWSRNR